MSREEWLDREIRTVVQGAPNAWLYGLFLVSLIGSGAGSLLLARFAGPHRVALAEG